MKLNNKNKKVLLDIFSNPTKRNILWADIEVLFRALGAEVSPGSGSRVRVYLNGVRATFHSPHPEKEAGVGIIRYVRRFLTEAGINPDRAEESGDDP